eukprot:scaffold8148_cov241-Isochrysis_galbana.AAC.9
MEKTADATQTATHSITKQAKAASLQRMQDASDDGGPTAGDRRREVPSARRPALGGCAMCAYTYS